MEDFPQMLLLENYLLIPHKTQKEYKTSILNGMRFGHPAKGFANEYTNTFSEKICYIVEHGLMRKVETLRENFILPGLQLL